MRISILALLLVSLSSGCCCGPRWGCGGHIGAYNDGCGPAYGGYGASYQQDCCGTAYNQPYVGTNQMSAYPDPYMSARSVSPVAQPALGTYGAASPPATTVVEGSVYPTTAIGPAESFPTYE